MYLVTQGVIQGWVVNLPGDPGPGLQGWGESMYLVTQGQAYRGGVNLCTW